MKYIDAEKLFAEIEQRRNNALERQKNLENIGQETVLNESIAFELNKILSFIESLQQEQPDFDDVDPNHLVHSHYTKVRETKTGRVFWAEYSSEAAEWYEAGTGKAYSISDVEIVKEQPEVDLKKEVKSYIKDNFTITDEVAQIPEEDRRYSMWEDDMVAFAKHFFELGRINARKEE